MADTRDIDGVLDRYRTALDKFSRGDPEPVKAVYSHRDDVTLANPFGPPVIGWAHVAKALDFASSRFSDGEVTAFETIVKNVTPDLVYILEVERWRARVGGRGDIAPFDLRVTTIFRREDDSWRMVHRHADPIMTAHPDGPLRGS